MSSRRVADTHVEPLISGRGTTEKDIHGMITASRNQGRVHAVSAWAEFGLGAAARTAVSPSPSAIEPTTLRFANGAPARWERLS